jgi:uncharacterized YigZ family protein
MKFVKKHFSSTLEVKKSKFIAHLFPYEQFDEVMGQLKEEHPKARHHVYAYRYLNEFDQIVENSSDDGEPKGTSGKPSLNVLNGGDIINTGVIIVRYFGGIKLGTGGLVKAYSDAVNLVLENSDLQTYVKLERIQISFDYSSLSIVEYNINQLELKIAGKEFLDNVSFIVEGSEEALAELIKILPRNIKSEKL